MEEDESGDESAVYINGEEEEKITFVDVVRYAIFGSEDEDEDEDEDDDDDDDDGDDDDDDEYKDD